jgi:hypothetical protein
MSNIHWRRNYVTRAAEPAAYNTIGSVGAIPSWIFHRLSTYKFYGIKSKFIIMKIDEAKIQRAENIAFFSLEI